MPPINWAFRALAGALYLSGAALASSPRNPGVIGARLEAELARAQRDKETVHPMVAQAATVDRSKWTASADSYEAGNAPSNVLDSNTSTFWHTEYSPVTAALPHSITIDMKKTMNLTGIVYTPRQDGNSNGNIGQHQIYLSPDNKTWSTISLGTFLDDSEVKTIPFSTTQARYLKISAITEAGNRGKTEQFFNISCSNAC